jgi:TatD DNase family protein
MQLHDTHVHLDLLLQQLKLIPEIDRNNPTIVSSFDHTQLEDLLKQHDFVIQATLTARNYLLNKALFGWNTKINYLLGMHPEEVTTQTNITEVIAEHTATLTAEVGYARLVGIGEIGLDYYWSDDEVVHTKQAQLFEAHIDLATQHNLPVVVHIRDKRGESMCMQDGIAILRNHPKSQFVVHCFTGTQADADEILGLGGYLGLGGIITYNSGTEILEIARNCPQDRFLLETDLPFLSPVTKRGEACLPEYISFISTKLAQTRKITEEAVWAQASANARQLFDKLDT